MKPRELTHCLNEWYGASVTHSHQEQRGVLCPVIVWAEIVGSLSEGVI